MNSAGLLLAMAVSVSTGLFLVRDPTMLPFAVSEQSDNRGHCHMAGLKENLVKAVSSELWPGNHQVFRDGVILQVQRGQEGRGDT